VRPRTQSGVAISADGKHWFLLNASPDLARQMESFPPLHPSAFNPRGTPIQGVLLTNADLDHTLGLLLLREGGRLPIYASNGTRKVLTGPVALLPILDSFCGINLSGASFQEEKLRHLDGSACALSYQAFEVPGKTPRFADALPPAGAGEGIAIGYRIRDAETGGSLAYVPEILVVKDSLPPLLSGCNLVLFDGTFWSETEMAENGINQVTAKQMGHVPIHGDHGSLRALAGVIGPTKVYIHINNTNPILLEDSPERRQTIAAGWRIGEDGMEFGI
jgi:pyrroloquinoline quinone biosynthesis protein B